MKRFRALTLSLAVLVAAGLAPRADAWCIQMNGNTCDVTFGSPSCTIASPTSKCYYDASGCRTGCGVGTFCDPFDPFCE